LTRAADHDANSQARSEFVDLVLAKRASLAELLAAIAKVMG
jgi:hypothetical protein